MANTFYHPGLKKVVVSLGGELHDLDSGNIEAEGHDYEDDGPLYSSFLGGTFDATPSRRAFQKRAMAARQQEQRKHYKHGFDHSPEAIAKIADRAIARRAALLGNQTPRRTMLAGSGQLLISNSMADPFTARSGASSTTQQRETQRDSVRDTVQPTDRSNFTQRSARGLDATQMQPQTEVTMSPIKWDRAPGSGFRMMPPKTPDAGSLYPGSSPSHPSPFSLRSPTHSMPSSTNTFSMRMPISNEDATFLLSSKSF
jgi:hypothetical protein